MEHSEPAPPEPPSGPPPDLQPDPEKPAGEIRLDYRSLLEPEAPTGRPPAWVFVIGVIYFLMLSVLLILPVAALIDFNEQIPVFIFFAAQVGVLLLSGASLMWIPVRKARRRVKRRSLLIPLAGSSVLIASLCLAGGFAVLDAMGPNPDIIIGLNPLNPQTIVYGAVMWVWFVWLVVFGWLSYSRVPESLSNRMYQWVIVGSVLELFVAVPAHLIARRRTECCAGLASGYAICVGTAIAIIALGPGVFLLFMRRWKAKYTKSDNVK